MNTKLIIYRIGAFFSLMLLISTLFGCQEDHTDFEQPTYPTTAEVFIDGFSSGLNYSAFGNSVPSAFQVDKEVTYNKSTASMRFDVPNSNNPEGSYAGGAFYTSVPRDLSGYNVLTFWAKAYTPVTIAELGYGVDLGTNTNQVSIKNTKLSTLWTKYYIPIPDASKLNAEKGMFYFSTGPDSNGNGYSFWIDDLKFENLGTVAHKSSYINGGSDTTEDIYFGVSKTISNFGASFNLPDGTQQSITLTKSYFTFKSSNTAVATVDKDGVITVVGQGKAVITATVGGVLSKGSVTLNALGNFPLPPAPTLPADEVISIFSNTYTNVPVDFYNGYWAPYQTTTSSDFVIEGNHILGYNNFNFVGIQFSKPTVDVSSMTTMKMSIYIPTELKAGAKFSVKLVDFGANGVFGGGDDKEVTVPFTSPTLVANSWITLSVPLSGLATKAHLAQIVLEGTNIPTFYADNIYFYNSTMPVVPTRAAPIPTTPAANVISIFSDTYTNVPGTDFNPNWSQATVTTQVSIAGNNTLKYAGLNYQGTQYTNQNVSGKTFLHVDYYTANSTELKFYLISPGKEVAYTLTVPSSGTNGWASVDIPLSTFLPTVNLSDVFQFKVVGNGEVYFDNIYFH